MELISALAADRKSGISLGGGLRKVRFARRNAGKGGGYRVIHFYRSRDMPLFLLTVLVKNEKANISPTDRAELIELCDLLAIPMESDMTNTAASIRRGLQEALTHAKGQKTGARVHPIEVPEPDVAAIRERSGLSQAEFARSIGVAVGTLRGWE